MNMQIHEAANVFPMMDQDRLEELAEDIKNNGLQIEIELFEGKIIDGRNRYKACLLAGVEPLFMEVMPPDPLKYVLSLNLQRRHLDSGQRAFVALNVEEYEAKAAKQRQVRKPLNSVQANLPEQTGQHATKPPNN